MRLMLTLPRNYGSFFNNDWCFKILVHRIKIYEYFKISSFKNISDQAFGWCLTAFNKLYH